MSRRVGLKFSENMYGTYTPVPAPDDDRRFLFHIDAVTNDLRQMLRDGRVETTGYVEAEGLASHASLRGFMIIKPIVARLIRYEFQFTGDDGASYRFVGEKTIRHLHPFRTWTTLPGAVYDSGGSEVARCMVFFDRKELNSFLRGFKLWLNAARPQPADG